ncbi:30S ribosomal protein S14 [Candidatus Pinguicoccus supinus]|uniref:Small ribosomal subunit protein uS14 n=1 Tax=Candidatus Pinguicoccus supinus TaxID=2529394 RepID=A0A7T0FY37_9BACT|nr:30S ribosomal protein S14 [Candidatus Pinguicoccus supinus]
MSKKSLIERNKKIRDLSKKYFKLRFDLKKQLVQEVNLQQKVNLLKKIEQLPRNSSLIRYRNRCNISGRSRAYIGYFGLSRITFRELAS